MDCHRDCASPGEGYFFAGQMITSAVLNGKGQLPLSQTKVAASFRGTPYIVPAGSNMGGSCRFGAPGAMIRHLAGKKYPSPGLV